MTPKEVVERWVERFNAADIEGLVSLYADNAVNDQVVFNKPLEGKDAIKNMFEVEFSRATMLCLIEQIYESGDTAILQWKDPLGLRGCGFFQVENDLIQHQKGYFDQMTFFKIQGLGIPADYLDTANR